MKVEGLVIVDNKAVTEWNPIFEAQMLTYLRLTGLKLGLVINFGERFVKNGIHRVANGLPDDVDFKPPPKHKNPKDDQD
jgi:GxxExxY protein